MFLLLLAARLTPGADKSVIIPSETRRFADPATEFPILRLTDPAHTSLLPAAYARAISRRGNWLLYANDRSGSFQLYRLDLKNGQSRQLTELDELEPSSGTLTADDKSIFCLPGRSVYQLSVSNLRAREVYRIPEGFTAGTGFAISEDGANATLIEKRAGTYRLRLVNVGRGSANTVVESTEELSDPVPRPRRAGILYRSAKRELHVVNFDGGQNQRLRTAGGGLGNALWGQDGRTVNYLNIPDDRKQLNNIREFTPDTNEDRMVAPTSQFVSFGRNADASMFVGASGSKASPYVLLLVRAVKRELTVGEHKASDARQVSPMFSPNSQRIFFQSDRQGKWAIYSMQVERFVEETE
ncbi:MAG: oligogalacturonate lyase family protein [Acidobacteriota bacterium]|nr:oligogalacturonate lyase family protein [Acidobacteriota bacterium]